MEIWGIGIGICTTGMGYFIFIFCHRAVLGLGSWAGLFFLGGGGILGGY